MKMMQDGKGRKPLWQIRHWILDAPPAGAGVWVFKVVHFRSDGHFDSLQLPSGITLRLIVRGRGTVSAGGRDYAVGAGQYFCALPGTLIRFHDTPQEPWEWWEWQLIGAEAMGYLQTLGVDRQHPVGLARRGGAAAQVLARLYEVFGEQQREPYRALALLYEAGALCASAPAPEEEGTRRQRVVALAQALLEGRPAEGVNVNELARATGVDRTTLLRAFRTCLNCTPLEYLRGRRLQRAREMLGATELPVREIARHTGFRTDKYFIRVFREAEGVTPAVWRKRGREGGNR